MGIDVNLYAVGDVTDEQFAEADRFIRDRIGLNDDWDHFKRDKYDPRRIELWCGNRYYGPGYERGDWPTIYGQIRVLQAALPHCTVHYGGDTSDDGIEVTTALLEELWQHFLGPNGDDYRKSARAFNARMAARDTP